MAGELQTNLAPAIKAKITQLQNAERDRAFVGAAAPEDRDSIEEYADWCRYELEQTILTHLERARNHS